MTTPAGTWGTFVAGQRAEIPFTVTDADMDAFLALSGDDSLSHTDADFCRAHGFDGRVVYGGLILANLSRLLGTELPGRYGLSNTWTVNFHRPLHVGEPAVLRGEIAHVSEGTRTIKIKYRVLVGERLVADGTVQSSVLEPTPDVEGIT
jgi:acyl dehydratase